MQTTKEKKIKLKFQKQFILFSAGTLIYLLFFLPLCEFPKFNFYQFSLPKNNEKIIKNLLTFIILMLNGYKVFEKAIIETFKKTIKNKKFTPNVHILMTLSALGSIYLDKQNESIILIIIFAGANFLEKYTDSKSQKEIQNMLKLTPTKARLLTKDNKIEIVDVKKLKIGNHILILNGDQIPSDGFIISGNSTINESNITGESIPVDKKIGDNVFGSTINITNSFIMEVTTENDQTVFAKIIQLVNQNKNNISKKATFIKKIEPIYVKSVLIISIIMLFVGFWTKTDNSSKDFFYKTIIFLTVASPCALAAADIPATLSTISNLARKSIIIKGGKILEIFANVKNICFDKTGTLTQGKQEVKDFIFVNDKISEKEKIDYLTILFAMEKNSNHPLAFAIKNFLEKNKKINNNLEIKTKNLIGIGIESHFKEKKYNVTKINYQTNKISNLIKEKTDFFLSEGKTVIAFTCDNKIIILITILVHLRPHAKEMIQYFNDKGINTFLITGDNFQTAKNIKEKLNIKKMFYDVLPHEKSEIIKSLKSKYGTTAMIGDGVNDAPALSMSDISITLKEGTDIAIDVADIVLIKNDLKQTIYLHKISQKLRIILWENIIFAMCIICILIFITFFKNLMLPIAVICHELSTILVILNSLRMLKKINESTNKKNT